MSYRLITKATFTVTSADGKTTEREVAVRAYPAPKRDAAGSININGVDAPYKRTGGKGRGAIDRLYAYATIQEQSAYWDLTEAEATAMKGGVSKLVTIAPVEAPTPAVVEATPAVEVTPEVAPEPVKLTKAQRRAAKQVA